MRRPAPQLLAAAGFLFCLALILRPVPAHAEGWWILNGNDWRAADHAREPVYALSFFGGEGTESNFSDVVENLFNVSGSSDRMLAFAGAQRFFWFRDQLSIDGELMYARHYGRETYHEIGAAIYLRWHDFPWNNYLKTTLAAGMGPSYTTIYPELERQDSGEDRSKILNQLNLEITAAHPALPNTSLMARMQHRSGMFGIINGVTDASNFLTIGLRQEF